MKHHGSRPIFNVLIVGCGNIAGGLDVGRADAPPLTHAGAYQAHGGFRLAACVEPDEARRSAFMATWGIPDGREKLSDLTGAGANFDVLSICSPTAMHQADLRTALALSPRLLFCEKPMTLTAASTLQITEQCETAGVLLAVNHTRRWAPDVVRLKSELASGRWGQLRCVVGHYNKGILNNGSHMLDLCNDLFGTLRPLWSGSPVADFWPDDPTVAAVLTTDDGIPIYLSPGNAVDYALFELEIVTSQGMLSMEESGLSWRWRAAHASSHFAGYRSLGTDERTPGEYGRAMSAAVGNIHDALAHGASLASTGRSAWEAQRLCEIIKEMACPGPIAKRAANE